MTRKRIASTPAVLCGVLLAALAGGAGNARVTGARSDLAAIKAGLEQRLNKLSAAKQRALSDVIAGLEQRLQQAGEQVAALEALESALDSGESHLALLEAEWAAAQSESDAAQRRLTASASQRSYDSRNLKSYRDMLYTKWGCSLSVQICERQFGPNESAAQAEFERDKNDFEQRRSTLERKWSGYQDQAAAAAEARTTADAKRGSYEQAREQRETLKAELQSKGQAFRTLGEQIDDGLRALDGEAPIHGGSSSAESRSNAGAPGLAGEPVRRIPGVNTSMLDKLKATRADEGARITGAGAFQNDCYENSGCIATNEDGVVVMPKAAPAVESRLAELSSYKTATERVTATDQSFRNAEAALLKAQRDRATPHADLQQLDKDRTAANSARIQRRMELATFALDLTPVKPRPAPHTEPPPPATGGREGSQ